MLTATVVFASMVFAAAIVMHVVNAIAAAPNGHAPLEAKLLFALAHLSLFACSFAIAYVVLGHVTVAVRLWAAGGL